MKKFQYNQLKYARIKSTIIGALVMLDGMALIYIFNIAESIILLLLARMVLLPLVTVLLLSFFSFGRVLEIVNKEEFNTYCELGSLRWDLKNYTSLEKVAIEQDEDKYYCVVVEHSGGQKLVLESYPTLDKTVERITELKKILT